MKRILFVNSCDREGSRSLRLAEKLLSRLGGAVTELRLADEELKPLSNAELSKREAFIAEGDYSDPMFRYAKQFAEADEIVIAAPYWDLSFPSELKIYFERVSVRGVTFTFTPEGEPIGLCRAKKLRYVTTMGAEGLPFDFGYGYAEAVCRIYYGIKEAQLIAACGLDLEGRDAEAILTEKEREISLMEL
jgi:FMN-dependent NADH-azoreductase